MDAPVTYPNYPLAFTEKAKIEQEKRKQHIILWWNKAPRGWYIAPWSPDLQMSELLREADDE